MSWRLELAWNSYSCFIPVQYNSLSTEISDKFSDSMPRQIGQPRYSFHPSLSNGYFHSTNENYKLSKSKYFLHVQKLTKKGI